MHRGQKNKFRRRRDRFHWAGLSRILLQVEISCILSGVMKVIELDREIRFRKFYRVCEMYIVKF